jgi:hypothetical protein
VIEDPFGDSFVHIQHSYTSAAGSADVVGREGGNADCLKSSFFVMLRGYSPFFCRHDGTMDSEGKQLRQNRRRSIRHHARSWAWAIPTFGNEPSLIREGQPFHLYLNSQLLVPVGDTLSKRPATAGSDTS